MEVLDYFKGDVVLSYILMIWNKMILYRIYLRNFNEVELLILEIVLRVSKC